MSPRPFIVERRPIPLKADLEAKFERALAVVGDERFAARVDSVLAVLKAEPQVVQEGVMAGLRVMLGKQYGKAAAPKKRPNARDAAEAAFKTTEAA